MKKDWLYRCTSSMKKGWLYRDSYENKNQEIAPVMMTQWWSRSSDDDPDPVMMIQQYWSILSDDPNPVMIQIEWWSRSDDEDDLKMKITWRWRWLEYEVNLKMKITWKMNMTWIWRQRELDDDLENKTCANKLCRENTFLVKRECWCICNFRMYSSVYLMYCTPMFIPGCVCNVLESCHAPMFLPGGSIM